MPLRLDAKRKLLARSDRVKAVDLHPTEPWICAALYNGNVHVWNIESQQLIKTFEVCEQPVRAVRFIARKNWIVTGSDDLQLRVFNYNTLECVHHMEAHSDYIRSIAVHPTQSFVLTSSDDMLIRLWDWEKNWTCAQLFEGHSHYVMQLVFNPKDNNTFASASLDHTVKVWTLGSPHPNFTLEGHQRGVNCVDYYIFGDKPYLASGADDKTIKIWDYQTKSCIHTLEGHAQNVSAVVFHPELPVVLSASEDGTVRVWHSSTFRLEATLNYGLERTWTMACHRGKQTVGIGYDEGLIVVSLGREEPAISMDATGKLVCARHSELVQANLRTLALGPEGADGLQDGERLPVSFKDMGACEIYPQTIAHNANGRFVVVCGDGEYIVYTAMALRNKTFGQAQEFVWSHDAHMYAVRESNSVVKVYKQFKELRTFKLDYGAEQIFGGHLLGVRSLTGLTFYDWTTGCLIRRIEINPRAVYWNEAGQLVALCAGDTVYILRYSADAAVIDAESNVENVDGFEQAFQVMANGEFSVSVQNGLWYGDAFLFTTTANRLCYYVGGELVTVAHLDRPMYLLGYLARENRVYLTDRDIQIVSYSLLLNVLEYETAVMRGDFDAADAIFPTIPKEHRTKVAQFLEKQGFKSQAMRVTNDPDHKFELALQLGDYDVCRQLAADGDPEANESKWKQLADAACRSCNFALARECLSRVRDYGSLMLLASCAGDAELVRWIGDETTAESKDNLAFLARFLLADLEGCLQILIKSERLPEAAFFARTYLPSRVPEVVELWRDWLMRTSKSQSKIAQALANPKDYPNLFPEYEKAVAIEKLMKQERANSLTLPASAYPEQTPPSERDLINEYDQGQLPRHFEQQRAKPTTDDYAFVPPASAVSAAQQEPPAAIEPMKGKVDQLASAAVVVKEDFEEEEDEGEESEEEEDDDEEEDGDDDEDEVEEFDEDETAALDEDLERELKSLNLTTAAKPSQSPSNEDRWSDADE